MWYQASVDADGAIVCKECPTKAQGVDCSNAGITIDQLPILPGFWRYKPKTSQVFACDHSRACIGSSISAASGSVSDAEANFDVGLCAEEYEGSLCG